MKSKIAELKEIDSILNNGSTPFESEVKTYSSNFLQDVRFLDHRKWLIKAALRCGYITEIVAPGGVGKSIIQLGMALSVATGENLVGLEVIEQANVLVINNEDDRDEGDRRIAGLCTYHSIDPARLEGKLFTYSGYGRPLKIATEDPDGNVVPSPDVEPLKEFITEQNIKALFLDPRISTHNSNENDNNKLDKVANIYKALARETEVAINIAHHTRKSGSENLGHGSELIAGDAEAGRGASSFKDAARGILTLARMSHKTAEHLGIDNSQQGRYFRMDQGKQNQDVLDKSVIWYYMESVLIPNGESVGVPVRKNMAPPV
ncbi:MAG: AAA family ATPase [Candidatus Thiodiazotropha endolucinida]